MALVGYTKHYLTPERLLSPQVQTRRRPHLLVRSLSSPLQVLRCSIGAHYDCGLGEGKPVSILVSKPFGPPISPPLNPSLTSHTTVQLLNIRSTASLKSVQRPH